jgi:hypothetical protein
MITGKESVFPQVVGIKVDVPGVDLRTWMATQFMAAVIISGQRSEIAVEAVTCADALIAVLNKPREVTP